MGTMKQEHYIHQTMPLTHMRSFLPPTVFPVKKCHINTNKASSWMIIQFLYSDCEWISPPSLTIMWQNQSIWYWNYTLHCNIKTGRRRETVCLSGGMWTSLICNVCQRAAVQADGSLRRKLFLYFLHNNSQATLNCYGYRANDITIMKFYISSLAFCIELRYENPQEIIYWPIVRYFGVVWRCWKCAI